MFLCYDGVRKDGRSKMTDPYMNDDVLEALYKTLDDEDFDATAMTTQFFGNDPYNWVTDRIAVGGDDYIFRPDTLQQMKDEGVTHVLDCRSEARMDRNWFGRNHYLDPRDSFIYCLNGTGDNGKPKTVDYFRKSINFGLNALDVPNAKLYVHCAAGYNRGPSSAYAIMLALGWSAADARDAMEDVRFVGLLYARDAEIAVRALGYTKAAPVTPVPEWRRDR